VSRLQVRVFLKGATRGTRVPYGNRAIEGLRRLTAAESDTKRLKERIAIRKLRIGNG